MKDSSDTVQNALIIEEKKAFLICFHAYGESGTFVCFSEIVDASG